MMVRVEDPTPQAELELIASGARLVAGIDEVGRGAWAGPVSVGIAVVDADRIARAPVGVRDSKMLSEARREELYPELCGWVVGYAVGHASPKECDRFGMTKAQRLAARRALRALDVAPDAFLLDGNFNYTGFRHLRTAPGLDRSSLVVACASVLAKVTRDRLMVGHGQRFPHYEFPQNKGYPSPAHLEALGRHGLSRLHRQSWSFADRFSPEQLADPAASDPERWDAASALAAHDVRER